VKITSAVDTSGSLSFEDFKRVSSPLFDQIRTAINGGIQIDNLRAKIVVLTIDQISTDLKVTHSLGVIPVGYYKIQGDNLSIYDAGVSTWTTENIFIRATSTGVCTVLVVG
jgi:hypothetical protein